MKKAKDSASRHRPGPHPHTHLLVLDGLGKVARDAVVLAPGHDRVVLRHNDSHERRVEAVAVDPHLANVLALLERVLELCVTGGGRQRPGRQGNHRQGPWRPASGLTFRRDVFALGELEDVLLAVDNLNGAVGQEL